MDDDYETTLETNDPVAARIDAVRMACIAFATFPDDKDFRELTKRLIDTAMPWVAKPEEKQKGQLASFKGGKQ